MNAARLIAALLFAVAAADAWAQPPVAEPAEGADVTPAAAPAETSVPAPEATDPQPPNITDEVPEPTGDPEGIQQNRPSFLVRIDVDRPTREYREGDTLVARVNCEEDAYLYVIYKQADGKVYQVFPNSAQPDNFVRARQAVQIPAFNDRFRWQIGAPFGKEVIKVIASKEPLEKLSDEQTRTKRFTPRSSDEMKGIALEIGEEPAAVWAEDQVELTTYARDQEEAQRGSKRFGVFFGVSDYLYNDQVKLADEEGHGLNLPCCHRDARKLQEAMSDVGRVDQTRVFTNEQATRTQMEQIITKWLPSVTRPGDTVVIYFSGHGAQFDDDNGDEKDHLDEHLLPHDYLGGKGIVGLLKQEEELKKEGKELPPHLAELLTAVREVVNQVGSPEKAVDLIGRNTSISDDVFGHWLQSLSGRQVIVVLDICHAGGFATQEKALQPSSLASGKFDFVDKELERLKDLGQPETALLAACAAQQLSQVRRDGELSVMTDGLLQTLLAARGVLTLEDGYTACSQSMKAYFDKLNEQRAARGESPITTHEPVLYDNCTKPALLKP